MYVAVLMNKAALLMSIGDDISEAAPVLLPLLPAMT